MIARNVTAREGDATQVAAELADRLDDPELRLAVVFADWRLDSAKLAQELQHKLGARPVVGCTTLGMVGADKGAAAVALGLYGDSVRVGVGTATDLPRSALTRSRDAVHEAAGALGTQAAALDPARHVAFTLVDGTCGYEEAFCIGSAATAAQIRFVGGSAATELAPTRRSVVWAHGKTHVDAGVVVVLELARPFEVVTSSHLQATDVKTVVTAASGRMIDELDGMPAARRLRSLVARLGATLDDSHPSEYSFARYVDGVPYVRSMTQLDGNRIRLASAVEAGHILHVMRPGDLIGQTQRDLATAAERIGGMSALLAFSCVGRHWEASARGLETELADAYATYPTTGFQSFGEQTGMLLVNHTLTALAIGAG